MVKNLSANAGDTWFYPWVGKIPWRREWQPTLVFLFGKSHGQRSLVDYSPWCCKRARLNDNNMNIEKCKNFFISQKLVSVKTS